MTFKFGDIIRNEWASDDNPTRILLVRDVTKRYVKCIAKDGSLVDCHNGKEARLVKVGELGLSAWMEIER